MLWIFSPILLAITKTLKIVAWLQSAGVCSSKPRFLGTEIPFCLWSWISHRIPGDAHIPWSLISQCGSIHNIEVFSSHCSHFSLLFLTLLTHSDCSHVFSFILHIPEWEHPKARHRQLTLLPLFSHIPQSSYCFSNSHSSHPSSQSGSIQKLDADKELFSSYIPHYDFLIHSSHPSAGRYTSLMWRRKNSQLNGKTLNAEQLSHSLCQGKY